MLKNIVSLIILHDYRSSEDLVVGWYRQVSQVRQVSQAASIRISSISMSGTQV